MGEGGALRADPHVEGTSHTTPHGKVTCSGVMSAPAVGSRVSSADNLNELVARVQGWGVTGRGREGGGAPAPLTLVSASRPCAEDIM